MSTPKRRKTALLRGQGPLFLLAFLMVTSGALRLGSEVGFAFARTNEEIAPPENSACPTPPEAVLQALQQREDALNIRELTLDERHAAISVADAAINAQIHKLEATEKALSATLVRAEGAAEADLARLTQMYEAMKPKIAADLFTAMAPEFAAGFLGRMSPDAAANILSGMATDAAYAASALLAARHNKVPTE